MMDIRKKTKNEKEKKKNEKKAMGRDRAGSLISVIRTL